MGKMRDRVNVLHSSTFIRQGPGKQVYLSSRNDLSLAAATTLYSRTYTRNMHEKKCVIA